MIKCFICSKRFHERAEYTTHITNAANCPVFASQPAGTCGNYSNVIKGFDEKRTNVPQFLYPIIGAAESGKSYYLHTITQNLVEHTDRALTKQIRALNLDFAAIAGYDLKEIRQLRQVQAKATLKGTVKIASENNIPIVLSCRYQVGTRLQKSADICFFDLAGVLFHDQEQFVNEDRRIADASGLIVFIDPFRDKGLNSKLLPDLQVPDIDIQNEARGLIRKLARLRRNGLIPKVSIPIAFCLSMFDLLEHNIPTEFADLYVHTQELSTEEGFNEPRINRQSKAIEKFLRKNSNLEIDFIQNNFLNYKWFALSTIGHNEIEDRPGKIDSRGIYAPLLWLFKNNGMV